MKKNKMMRIASILLVVTLLSTCVISGTFAKYVTKAEGKDEARVAKWGVLVSVEGGTFADTYEATDEAYLAAEGEYSVVSSLEDQVVAPGTNSDQVGDKLVATVVGTPEVAARYILEVKDVTDVMLPAAEYTDYTQYYFNDDEHDDGYTGKFTLENPYSPIKWNLLIKKGNTEFNVATELYNALPPALMTEAEKYGMSANGCSIFAALAILEKVANGNNGAGYTDIIDAALGNVVNGGRNYQLELGEDGKSLKMSYDFDPNKTMDFTFELTWEWAFSDAEEETEVTLNDKADTFLGNWAAVEIGGQQIEGFVAPEAPASIKVGATVIATAVQID